MDIRNICSFLHNGYFVKETFFFLFKKVTIYRWLLILLYAHMELIRNFDFLNAFGYIERVVKSDFFSLGKYLFLHHACATCSEQPSNIKTMHQPLIHGSFTVKIISVRRPILMTYENNNII